MYWPYTSRLMLQLTILLFLFPLPSAADTSKVESNDREQPDSLKTLDRVVITASRTKRLLSETPASVSIIDKDEIDASPAKNIDDLLMTEMGIQVKRVAGMGEGIPSDIIIRGIPGGFGANRTLVLIDGIPTNASGTPFLILNEIPMDIIKRVEIVRGPYSSLYGANAFGGVVNIITEDIFTKPLIKAYFETSFPFTVLHTYVINERSLKTSFKKSASDTYWNGVGSGVIGNDKISFLASCGFRTIGNYLLRDTAIIRDGPKIKSKKTDNHDYRDVRVFSKIGYTLNDHIDMYLNARYFNSELGYGQTKRIIPDSADIITGGEKIVVGPEINLSIQERHAIKIRAYYRRLIGEFWNEEIINDSLAPYGVRSYWRSQTDDWQLESHAVFNLGKNQVLSIGGEHLQNSIFFGAKENPDSNNKPIPNTYSVKEKITNTGIYIQDEISLFKRLNIVPGFRFDYHSAFSSALSPKLGISFKINDLFRVSTSLGRAFRAPTLSELYMPNLTIKPNFILVSNASLIPEYIWAWDFLLDITPLPLLKTKIGFYNNQMKDLIGQAPAFQGTAINVTYQNISRAWSRGIEMEGEWDIKKDYIFFANFVLQFSRNEHASDMREIFRAKKHYTKDDLKVPLDYIPNHSFNLGFRMKKQFKAMQLQTNVTESFVGTRHYLEMTAVDPVKDVIPKIIQGTLVIFVDPPLIELEPYWRTDLCIRCIFNNMWLALNVQNLFNAEYEESGANFATGRFISLKIGSGEWTW